MGLLQSRVQMDIIKASAKASKEQADRINFKAHTNNVFL